MRSALCVAALCAALSLSPPSAVGQDEPDASSDPVASLLSSTVDPTVLEGLGRRFFDAFMFLVPDLPQEDREVLADAVQAAFDASAVRADLRDGIAEQASPERIARLIDDRATGAHAELERAAAAYTPPQSLEDFVAGLDAAGRERLQLMAALAEARGVGDELLVEEAVRDAAHALYAQLGGAPGSFQPLPEEAFDAAYRDRILTHALELLHRLQQVPDELVTRALDELGSPASVWYRDAHAASMQKAVTAAGQRVAALTAAQDEPEAEATGSGPPCRTTRCGFVVAWEGREPTDTNGKWGASGDLEVRILGNLTAGGYNLTRGIHDEGLTIQLRARTMVALCDFMSGTDNRGCTAIDRVRVEFVGEDPEFGTADGFLLRNRCGGDAAMAVDGVAALTAARIDYALTTYPGDEREVPHC